MEHDYLVFDDEELWDWDLSEGRPTPEEIAQDVRIDAMIEEYLRGINKVILIGGE